jgi:hypothetical protein
MKKGLGGAAREKVQDTCDTRKVKWMHGSSALCGEVKTQKDLNLILAKGSLETNHTMDLVQKASLGPFNAVSVFQ